MVNITTLSISEPLLHEFKEAIRKKNNGRFNKGIVRMETEKAIRAHIEQINS